MHADQMRQRIAQWTVTLKVNPTQIRLQRMTRKWASCSSAGRVTFNLELLGKPTAFQDCVIVHELLHLRIRNHGKLFAATLRAHLAHNPWVDHI
ncbi:MAG: M48 family metallopeptidase [Xanthomonadales bacterium]|nr:M48 family metallopeptidase [Xanthomonadales bacterium]